MRSRLHLAVLTAILSVSPQVSFGVETSPPQSTSAPALAYEFALASQPLPDSLAAINRLTGQNIVYTDEAILSLRAPALKGRYTVEQAISRLLADTPVTWHRVDPRTVAISAVTSGGDSIQLHALDIEAEGWSGYQPDPTVRVSHSSAPWLEQAQAISRVPNAVLRDQNPRNLDDALRNVSGVTQGNTLGSTQDTLMKRGFGDNRDGSILRDGMPTIQGRNFNATTDHIEVLKGPSALLYGIQDPGGMINVVSKVPELYAHNQLQSKASFFAHGRTGSSLTLDSTGPMGQSGFAYRLILDHQDEDYWRNYGVHRETLISPSLAWYGDQDEVRLTVEDRTFITPFDRGTAIDPTTGRVLDIPYDRRLDEHFNDMRGRSRLVKANYDHRFDDIWQLHASASYNHERYDAYQVRVTRVNAAQGTLTRSLDGTLGSDSNDKQAYVEVAGMPEVLGMKHDLLIGTVTEHRLYFRGDLIREASQNTFNYLDPVYGQEATPTTVSASDSDQRDKLRTSALYMRDSIHLTEQLIATLGGRFLTYDQYAGRGRPFRANTDINGSAFVPSTGLLYRFAPDWSWYVSYSESLKPNSSIAPLNASSAQIIDSTIEPEQAKAWETGLKYESQGGLTASLAVYDIRKRNILINETINGLPVSRNAGSVRSRGIELELSGRLTDSWELLAAYAFTDAFVTQDPTLEGNRLQNVPRQSGSFYVSHDFGAVLGSQRLRVGGGPRYVSQRSGDAANSFDLPAYTVTDGFARYDTNIGDQKLQLQLNINNLFDKHYYPSSVNSNMVSVGDPRQFVLSSTLDF
jgi:iron complex outermembrane receptor protein